MLMPNRVKEIRELCTQISPEIFKGDKSNDDFFFSLMCYFMASKGVQTYFDDVINKNLYEITLEDCEKAYEKGLLPILNDGKLLGFKKAA